MELFQRVTAASIGAISGSGAAGQVAVFNGASSITGYSTFNFDSVNASLSVGGLSTIANGGFNFGNNNSVTGVGSGLIGNTSTVSGDLSYGFGDQVIVSGNRSYALGAVVNVSGDRSYGFGQSITVSGTRSFGFSLDTGGYTVSANNVFAVLGGKVGIGIASPNSTLHLAGSLTLKRTPTAISYTATTDDLIIAVTSTAAARTITLPSIASVGVGKYYIIMDESGGAAANNITIDPDGAELINGAATYAINTNYGSVTIYTNGGTGWFIV